MEFVHICHCDAADATSELAQNKIQNEKHLDAFSAVTCIRWLFFTLHMELWSMAGKRCAAKQLNTVRARSTERKTKIAPKKIAFRWQMENSHICIYFHTHCCWKTVAHRRWRRWRRRWRRENAGMHRCTHLCAWRFSFRWHWSHRPTPLTLYRVFQQEPQHSTNFSPMVNFENQIAYTQKTFQIHH